MRVLVVGASGTLGSAVATAFAAEGHEVLEASRRGDLRVDLTRPETIAELYAATGQVDAVACTAGVTPFRPLAELTLDDVRAGVTDKLLGQVALVLQGLAVLSDGGSFTLVSGITAHDPIRTGAVAGTASGAVDAFVRGSAIEMPRGLRINAVSATVFEESWDAYGEAFAGFRPAPVAEAARAYLKSALGAQTGRVLRVGY